MRMLELLGGLIVAVAIAVGTYHMLAFIFNRNQIKERDNDKTDS